MFLLFLFQKIVSTEFLNLPLTWAFFKLNYLCSYEPLGQYYALDLIAKCAVINEYYIGKKKKVLSEDVDIKI